MLSRPAAPALTIELIPQHFWGSSLANNLAGAQWQRCRTWALERAGRHCVVCGTGGALHCHEEWAYEDRPEGHVRVLTDLTILCADCHATKHMGRTFQVDEAAANRLAVRMMLINHWTQAQVQRHLDEAMATFRQRNSLRWVGTDLTWLRENVGIEAVL